MIEGVLSNSEPITVGYVIFATGCRAELSELPYLEGFSGDVEVAEGYPVLDKASPSGAAIRDFGPSFGFTKAGPAAATLLVDDLLSAG
jgi:hypothetical protein